MYHYEGGQAPFYHPPKHHAHHGIEGRSEHAGQQMAAVQDAAQEGVVHDRVQFSTVSRSGQDWEGGGQTGRGGFELSRGG